MLNYVNEVSIYGLMNKNAFINTDVNVLSIYKTKNKRKVVYFNLVDNEQDYDQVNYMYLDKDPGRKASKMSQVVSIINKDMFTSMPGKQYRELRETVNKYSQKIKVKFICDNDREAIIDMIEKWRYMDNGGMKYGWQEHGGIDKFVVNKYIDDEEFMKETIGLSFWYNDKCIGYSLIEKNNRNIENGIPEYKYLTRKVLCLKELRNITEYVDWYTFGVLRDICGNRDKFLINWGCSSGGVLWYKTNKWPVYSLEDKWFLTVKNKK